MWHKPCRTFHPWCPCIKTRCLSKIETQPPLLEPRKYKPKKTEHHTPYMMASWNGKAFPITGPLREECICQQWFPPHVLVDMCCCWFDAVVSEIGAYLKFGCYRVRIRETTRILVWFIYCGGSEISKCQGIMRLRWPFFKLSSDDQTSGITLNS